MYDEKRFLRAKSVSRTYISNVFFYIYLLFILLLQVTTININSCAIYLNKFWPKINLIFDKLFHNIIFLEYYYLLLFELILYNE